MNTNSDKKLIADYLKGDEKSLEILIHRYLKPIYSFVYRYVNNRQEAEDITQEVFVRVWRNLKKFKRSKSFKTWIFTIAKNSCIDFFRKKKTIPFSEPEDIAGEDKFFERTNINQLLQFAKDKLMPKYQLVLSLYYNQNLNFREISETTGEPLNTIKSRHRRALILLKKSLEFLQ